MSPKNQIDIPDQVSEVLGLIHHFIPRFGAPNVSQGMDERKIDYEPIPGGLLISVVSLVGGFSLGPEVPTGMLAGGSATAIAQRSKWDDPTQKVTFDAAVVAPAEACSPLPSSSRS